MKKAILSLIPICLFLYGNTQNIDAMFSQPQQIELSISTPQPRMGETFQLTLDINHIRANIFKSVIEKISLADNRGTSSNNELVTNVTAAQKGKVEIGPLKFMLDRTTYTTNKITYEVVDALPNTDRGLWFRKVNLGDSTFCIIIEQRIPAKEKTVTNGNRTTFSTEPEYNEIVKFKDSYSIKNLHGGDSHSSTSFSSIEINGQDKQFMYAYGVYYFTINDKNVKIIITKDKFDNIPADYKFPDIIIQ